MRLSECPVRSNNLQLLRFVAAILVIVSHSFVLSTGDGTNEWLYLLTNGQLSLGELAVSVFFCAGGYLIAKSILRTNNGLIYFKARVLKIFPGLVIVVVVTTFVLGPLMTEYSIGEYFENSEVYKYLLNGVMILQHNLPGVFVDNPSVQTVNGSLWTLPVEFLCYIGCFVMWKMKLLEEKTFKWSVPVVLTGAIGLYKIIQYYQIDILISAIRPGLLFYMGMAYYVFRDRIAFTKKGLLISLLIICVTTICGIIDVGLIIGFPYLLLYSCFAIPQVPEKLGRWGDISYGIYLCGFPIQQTIVACNGGNMSPYYNVLIATPLAIFLGCLTYSLIEVPIMRLDKQKLTK